MRPENIRSLDLNLLAVADALFETRNVTEAAKIVHLSQPAVSRALGRLRDQLGDPLLVRERRTMRLTPFAQRLRPQLRSALLQLERTLLEVDVFDPSTARGSLTVASADYGAIVFAPGAIRLLAERAPGIQLTMTRYVEPFEALLETSECDLVVGHRPSDKTWIESELLVDSGWTCLARKRHPWLRAPSLEGYCEARHVMVSPGGQGGGPVDGALARRGLRRHIAARVSDFAGALAIAAQTDLLVTVPEPLGSTATRLHRLSAAPVPIEVPRSRIFMSWHAAQTSDPRATWMREQVAALVRP